MHSNITNHYDIALRRPKLKTQQSVIFSPTVEWRFAHIPHVTWFKGKFYVMWASGHINEDDVGQVVRYAVSDDFIHWQPHKILVGPVKSSGKYDGVLSPNGWHVHGDTLVAYFMSFEEDESTLVDGRRFVPPSRHLNFQNFYMTTTDGENWSDYAPREGGGGNHSNILLSDGNLLSCENNICTISSNHDGISGWEKIEMFQRGYPNRPSVVPEGGLDPAVDQPAGVVRDDRVGLCEACPVELPDGRIVCFYRSGTPHLWATFSEDAGRSWSLPEPTEFTDNRTKFHISRLPNGKYYYIGTPDPFPPRTRHVLALSLSGDGLDYDQHFLLDDTQYKGKYVGLDKAGIYGYPTSIVRDGHLHIVFSICKEQIVAMRLPCDTL